MFKSADECKKTCSDNQKCVSAECYGDNPTQCDRSSTCTTKDMLDAPKDFDVILFMKQRAGVTTAGHGTDPPLSHNPLLLRMDAAHGAPHIHRTQPHHFCLFFEKLANRFPRTICMHTFSSVFFFFPFSCQLINISIFLFKRITQVPFRLK